MREGKLPARYLGVPLVSTRLSSADCAALVEKIIGRSDSWIAKKLSFADRIHLLTSILYNIQAYWTGIFILPKKIKPLNRNSIGFFGMAKKMELPKPKLHGIRYVFRRRREGWVLKNWSNGIKL